MPIESEVTEAVRSTSAGLGLSASGSLTEAISEALAVLIAKPLTAEFTAAIELIPTAARAMP